MTENPILASLIGAGFSLGILMLFMMGDTIIAKLHDFYGSVKNDWYKRS